MGSGNNDINPELFSQLFDKNCKDLKTRFFDIDEEQLCSGIPKIIFPRQAKNLKDEWRYIVNIENYTQSVELEECFNPDFTVCRQLFTSHKLLALSTEGQLVVDSF